MSKSMKLVKHLANLGYGSRKEVAWMFREGRVTDADGEVLYADDPLDHDNVRVDGEPLDPPQGLVLMATGSVLAGAAVREVAAGAEQDGVVALVAEHPVVAAERLRLALRLVVEVDEVGIVRPDPDPAGATPRFEQFLADAHA